MLIPHLVVVLNHFGYGVPVNALAPPGDDHIYTTVLHSVCNVLAPSSN